MSEEIICPECGSSSIKQRTQKAAVGSGRGDYGWELPEEEDYTFFECQNCGNEFDESDLVED